jgi:hypothetical protein
MKMYITGWNVTIRWSDLPQGRRTDGAEEGAENRFRLPARPLDRRLVVRCGGERRLDVTQRQIHRRHFHAVRRRELPEPVWSECVYLRSVMIETRRRRRRRR